MTNHDEKIPRHRRKLKITHIIIVLLLVVTVGFIIFRFSLKSRLQSKLDAISAAGYPVSCAELDAWYSIPDFSKNAADTIIEAFSHYFEWDKEYLEKLPVAGRAQLPACTEPLSEEMKALITEYLADNKEAIALLHEGAAMEHSRYPVDFTQGFNILMPHLGDIRKGVRMLELEAVLHVENNEPKLAVDSIKSIFGIARSLANEPILISQLVRIACQALAVSALERIVNRIQLTDKLLTELRLMLVNTENRDGFSRAFAGGRCIVSDFLKNPTSQSLSLYGKPSISTPLITLYKFAGLADADALLHIDLMTNYIEAMRLKPHQRKKAAEAAEAELNKISKIHVLLHTAMPALSRCITIDLRCIANLRTSRLALAIENYRITTGNLPDALGDLVPNYLDTIPKDPFDGEALRYKKLDVGFIVYSVGEDGHDDGGKERPPKIKKGADFDTYDITFIIGR